MNYCSDCGAPVALRIPDGDTLPRHCCGACGAIHYRNPRIVTGTIVEHDGRLLLCRRAIEPCHGLWTLPAGYMENGETVEQAAARETLEEACAEVEIIAPYTLFSLPQISQVYLFYRARLTRDHHAPGLESLETALVEPARIPWSRIAFPVVEKTLRHYLADRPEGRFELRSETVLRTPRRVAGGG